VSVEGGVPLISDGRIIGAIGVSGDISENDALCDNAAALALNIGSTVLAVRDSQRNPLSLQSPSERRKTRSSAGLLAHG
jgi:heme-degrading protein